MPYKKNYRKRTFRRKRGYRGYNPLKRYVKKDRSNLKWAKIGRDIMYLKSRINTETKYKDTDRPGNSQEYYVLEAAPVQSDISTAGSVGNQGYVVAAPQYPDQGDDFDQREGRSIKLKSIQVKGRISAAELADTTVFNQDGKFTIYIVVDHQAQISENTDPVPILWNLDLNGNYSRQSRINRQHTKRYSFLAAKTIRLAAGFKTVTDFNIFKRLNDKLLFDGTLGTDYMDKRFFCVCLADTNFDTDGASFYPRACVQLQFRLTYVDN